jgi:hypothetical protein
MVEFVLVSSEPFQPSGYSRVRFVIQIVTRIGETIKEFSEFVGRSLHPEAEAIRFIVFIKAV